MKSDFVSLVLLLLITVSAATVYAKTIPFPPPARNDFTRLTSYEELIGYMQELDDASALARYQSIGESVEGRDLGSLFISADDSVGADETKPLVLIYAQQHGDETSGSEAAMLLAERLLSVRRDLLKNLDLILIPRMNPDGGNLLQRRNANDMDLNRNHLVLSEPETQALHNLFRCLMPHVTLDVHEYGGLGMSWIEQGFVKDAQVMIGTISNPNIDPELIEEAKSWLDPIDQRVEGQGFSFHEYVVGTPFDDDRMRYSTTDVTDGRNSLGIYNTLSFIQEGKQYGDPVRHLEKRAGAQLAAMIAFLEEVVTNRQDILHKIEAARAKLRKSRDSYPNAAVQYDYFPVATDTTITLPVFDLSEWQQAERTLGNFHRDVRVKRSVPRPAGYVISSEVANDTLEQLLQWHDIRYERLTSSRRLEVERVTVVHVTPMEEEELTVSNVDTRFEPVKTEFAAGSLLIPIDQPAALLLPVMFEAQSTRGLMNNASAHHLARHAWLEEGEVFPIYRLR